MPEEKYIATAQRLKLRKITEEDFSFLYEIFNIPKAMEFFPSLRNGEQTKEWIQFNLDSYRKNNFGKWIIENNDGKSIGHCGLVWTSIDGVDEIELGYFLHPDFWGQGYAIEAAQLGKDLALQKYGFKKIISAINPLNKPSIKVAEKLGMRREKTAVASAVGYTWNCVVYSLSK